jgi:hypothetical protein
MPWHARRADDTPVHGGRCCYCDREIAVPNEYRGKHMGCIYCGLDKGLMPEQEIEPCEHTNGIFQKCQP